MKHFAPAALLLAGALALAGCTAEEPAPPRPDGGSLGFSADEVIALGGQDNVDYMTDLYEQAIAAGQTTITVYGVTATSSAPLYEVFSQRFPGIGVEHVTIFGPEMQNRIASEQATGQYLVDNLSVNGTDALFVADNDFAAEQHPPLAAQLDDEYLPAGDTLFGANTYIFTVSYNTDLVDEAEAPRSFEDLLDPKWRGKIAVGNVGTANYGMLFGGIYQGVIDEGWVEDFAATGPVIVQNERDVFAAVSTGQVPIGLNTYIRGQALIEKDDLPVAFVADFEDGVGDGVYYRGTAVNAPNPLASDLLTAWWLTPEAMTLLAAQGQAGLMPDAPPIDGQPPLAEMTVNTTPSIADDYESEAQRQLEMFQDIFGV